MYKKSINEFLGLLIMRIAYSLGVGAILAIALVVTKKMPDTLESTLLVVSPFVIVGTIYFLFRYCNSIEITETEIIISNLLGKKQVYSKNAHSFEVDIVNHTLNSAAHLCYTLVLNVSDNGLCNKTWRLPGYPKAELERILEQLPLAQNQ